MASRASASRGVLRLPMAVSLAALRSVCTRHLHRLDVRVSCLSSCYVIACTGRLAVHKQSGQRLRS